jgi:hypothetical protein
VSIYVVFLIVALVAGVLALAGVWFLAFRWGSFAGLTARSQESPKWQAYLLALLPPCAFALTFLFDSNLARIAPEAFASLAMPAALGACLCYSRNQGSYKQLRTR